MMKQRPTLATLASAANVHVSTVSRALSSDIAVRRGVAPPTVARIKRLAEELRYRRHPAGAELRTGRSHVIGVLVPRLTDIVLATVYEGINAAADAAGYSTFVANTGDDRDIQRRRAEALLARRVDGLILGDTRTDSTLAIELRSRGVEVVLVSRRLRGFVSVTTHDPHGGRLAAEHVLGLGHQHMGIVAGRANTSTGMERTQGFLNACRRVGVMVPTQNVVWSGFDVAAGRAAGERLLRLRPQPTAIFAVNDFAAIGVMGAIRDHGMTVGVDVALVGYNDVPLAAELPVPLTSVHAPVFRMGEVAATTLIGILGGQRGRSRRLEPELRVRQSTVPARMT